MEFITNLLSFSTRINNFDLNKTSLKHIIWFEENYIEDDYLNKYCHNFQISLIAAEAKVLKLIISNLDMAISSQCGNNIDLSIYTDADDSKWNFKWDTNSDQNNLNRRYTIKKMVPNNEKIIKELWLRNFLRNLLKIVTNIREVTNYPNQVVLYKSSSLDSKSKINTQNSGCKKQLNDFIFNVIDKEGFIEDLKVLLPTEKGKKIKSVINLLIENEVLIILDREFKIFYNLLKNEFNRNIGSYPSINDVKFIDHVYLSQIEKIIKPLIIKYKEN